MDLENRLEKLKMQAKSAGPLVKIFNREQLGVQRKLTNLKMRIRSMKIKRGETYAERLSTSLPIFDSTTVRQKNNFNMSLRFTDSDSESKPITEAITETEEVSKETTKEITELDEEFDPTELFLDHQRPIRTLLPDIALPHSVLQDQWVWTRSVAMWRFPQDDNSLMEGEFNGHYKDVEDEHLETNIDPAETGESANPDDVATIVVGDKPELMKTEVGSSCCCERPIAVIRCEAECGFTLRGRLSLPCPAHPGRRHLMDHQPVCPHCGQRLVETQNFNSTEDIDNNNTVIDPKYYGPNFSIVKPKLNVIKSKRIISSI